MRERTLDRKAQDVGHEEVHTVLDKHYNIGKSQNDSEAIGVFLQRHTGDPVIKVQIPSPHLCKDQ